MRIMKHNKYRKSAAFRKSFRLTSGGALDSRLAAEPAKHGRQAAGDPA